MSKLPKYYSQVCKNKPDDYMHYDQFNIKLGNPQRYEIKQQVGRGNYSDVFYGLDSSSNKPVIIKFLKPVKMVKVKREIKILQLLNGLNNTIKLLDVVKFPNQKAPSLIFEHIDNACEQDFRKFYANLDEKEIRHYMLELLKALDYINSKGIMHRDIKPHNIVIDHEKKRLKLIDFGLAEYYLPNQEYNVRVASRYFKGPELLLENPIYDYSVDIWSLGCLFAGILFMREPFFAGEDNLGQLVKITKVVGTEEILLYMDKYDLELNDGIQLAHYEKRAFSCFINEKNRSRISDDAIDLLDRMLQVDHAKRITPKDAMRHPYFQTKSKQVVPKLPLSELKVNAASKQTYLKVAKPNINQRHQSPQPWSQPQDTSSSPRKHHYFVSANKTERMQNQENLFVAQPAEEDVDEHEEEPCELPESNINVVVRVRPILHNQNEKNDICIISTSDNNQVQIMDPKDFTVQQSQELLSVQGDSQLCYYRTSFNMKKGSIVSGQSQSYERNYNYDMVFGQQSTNREIYDAVIKNMTKVVLGGYNATIFAYGVTGAGKTHTMIGYEDEPGLMYYTINDMFEGIRGQMSPRRNSQKNIQIEVSFLEIYNEQIRDLIVPQGQPLELREDPQSGIQINGLSVFEVKQKDQIFELLAKGNAHRTQESTRQNQTSSRSHAVLIITYKQENVSQGEMMTLGKTGKLSLIDLAGSERASKTGNTGQRMKEGAHINKSLLALGNCINLLYENGRSGQKKHVPFRDSKLTRILKESLIGNSKTLMIANISPSSQNYEDTLNTLKYANRTKDLKTKIKKNIVPAQSNQLLIEQQNQHINNLQNEIESLRAELAQQRQQQTPAAIQPLEQSQDLTTDDEDDELFLQIKKRIMEQFNEENYFQAQLKNLYIEYENLLFQQKMIKIEAFVQENKGVMRYQQDYQGMQILQESGSGTINHVGPQTEHLVFMLQGQLRQITENELILTTRIDAVREEQKNLIRRRNQLKDYIQEQLKEIKKRDYYGQRTPRGYGLSKIQAEILETLFQSNEQQIQNTAMQMKEQRLNIKMAKKEYMISCMAQQVDLREFCTITDMADRQNFLSKQQIDEILRDPGECPTPDQASLRAAMVSNMAANSRMHQRKPSHVSASLNVKQFQEYQAMNNDDLGQTIHMQANQQKIKKIFSKPQSRQRSRGSPSVEEFARNARLNQSRNTSKSRSSIRENFKSQEKFPSELNNQNSCRSQQNANEPSDSTNGIKLYQPLKKNVRVANVVVRPKATGPAQQIEYRSQSARKYSTVKNEKRQLDHQFVSPVKKSRDLKNMPRQTALKNPRKNYATATPNNKSMVDQKKDASPRKERKNDLMVRHSFNHPRASQTSRGASNSKQSVSGNKLASANPSESRSIYAKITSTMPKRAPLKSKGLLVTEQRRKKDLDDDQPSLSEVDNQHYFKRHHTVEQDHESQGDDLSQPKSSHEDNKVQSQLLLNQPDCLESQGWFQGGNGLDLPSSTNLLVSDMAKYSVNRRDLYRNARNSSKEIKQKIRRESQSPELMQDIQVVIDDVNHRISEYEEYKSSFADQEADSQPGPYPSMSTKSATVACRASSSDKGSIFNNQFQSIHLQQSIHGSDAQKQMNPNLYFMKGRPSSLRVSMANQYQFKGCLSVNELNLQRIFQQKSKAKIIIVPYKHK